MVSVIIPTFNRSTLVCRAVETALGQTRAPSEVIVVDDGSKDDTRDRLRAYGSRIKYIYQENAGVSQARNTGVIAASGNWIAFLDSDDEWLPRKLEMQLGDIERNPNLIAHVTNSYVTTPNGELDLFKAQGFEGDKYLRYSPRPLSLVLDRTLFFTPAYIVNRAVLTKLGLFRTDFTLFEDLEVFSRLALEGAWGIEREPLIRVNSCGLSCQSQTRPVYACGCLAKIYGSLLCDARLTSIERDTVRRLLSWSELKLADAYGKEGENAARVSCLVRALRARPTLKNLVKVGVRLCAGHAGAELLERFSGGKVPFVRRSDLAAS